MSWVDGAWIDDIYQRVEQWCPTCAPDAILTQPWEMVYCDPHRPLSTGAMDHIIRDAVYLNGNMDSGGSDSTAFANLIHRGVVST